MGLIFTLVADKSAIQWFKAWVNYLDEYLHQHDNDLFTDSLAWVCLGTAMGFSIMNWFVI